MEPELIADVACVVGESPIWHPGEERVYWLDIPTGRVFRYDPAARTHERILQGDVVGGLTVQADGGLLLFMTEGAIKLWHQGNLTAVVDSVPDQSGFRFNDVIADPKGRVFCGTMAYRNPSDRVSRHAFQRVKAKLRDRFPKLRGRLHGLLRGLKPGNRPCGALYRLDPKGAPIKLLDGIALSNGMGFAPDRRRFYLTDSFKREIYVFDYDVDTGNLGNQRVFVRIPKGEGTPDGMTVDAAGFVWSARWDGGCVARYAPDGSIDRVIRFPVKKVTSIAFGGPDYTDIYVTTAGGADGQAAGPGAGGLFHLNLGIQGMAEFPSRRWIPATSTRENPSP